MCLRTGKPEDTRVAEERGREFRRWGFNARDVWCMHTRLLADVVPVQDIWDGPCRVRSGPV